jgi:RES domain
MRTEPIACVECFTNTGFRCVVATLGCEPEVCPRCQNLAIAIGVEALAKAVQQFFVQGSLVVGTMAPIYEVNTKNPDPACFDPTLQLDASLASMLTGQTVFYNAPPLWRVGETNLKYECDKGGTARTSALENLVSRVPRLVIPSGTSLFRIRSNPELDVTIVRPEAFDPPPASVERVRGRWDDGSSPVLYASDDIELCLHECRVAVGDDIVVATLRFERDIKLLDLTADIACADPSPFEDLNIFAEFLSISRDENWLSYARSVAAEAQRCGLGGIRYKSYFAQAKQKTSSKNVALFGRPLAAGLLSLQSINNVRLADAQYKFALGPVSTPTGWENL